MSLVDRLDTDTILERQELIEIGRELIDNDADSFNNNNLNRLQYMLEAGKPVKLREVQNVFLDYAERAMRGKVGGKTRKTRKMRKTRKARKIRKTRKGNEKN